VRATDTAVSVGLALTAWAALGFAQDLRFQNATVSLNASASLSGGSEIRPGGRVTITNTSMRDTLRLIYDVPDFAIVGAPEWLASERYDIEAQAAGNPSRDELKAMMRSLLADQFKLIAHREFRKVPVFELRRLRDDGVLGPGLVPAKISCEVGSTAACPHELSAGSYTAKGMPVPRLVRTLAELAGRPLIDRTNLSGTYDVSLTWTPGRPILAAVREQLGLNLETSDEPAQVLVIDSVVRPEKR
jgi:uncharacterized protein (TIGR03435 family)